ncbi:MAG TPA: NAD(P)H-binding protein [Solirubrobacteraceae bacterium]|nr:NAD(P)H-binding protein [Solirubrobacteraceae bacterium]
MLLLTGATGVVGSALLRRLVAEGEQVRCLVRDPRRLGAQRVRVQIALGDLADPPSFRNAMRGVRTVVHLAASIRDQPRGSIEELNGIATWRMVQAAERAGVERFVFFSALGASTHHRARFFRAKALAEQAVGEADVQSIVFAPSIVYAPGDPWLTLLERMALLPVMPVSGRGRALYQPIWAEDVAECVIAALRGPAGPGEGRAASGERGGAGVGSEARSGNGFGTNGGGAAVGTAAERRAGAERRLRSRYELAGPETLSHNDLVRILLRSVDRRRPLLHVPTPIVSRSLRLLERALGPNAFATWDEAELMEVTMVSARGTADVEELGVAPARMPAVLGIGG